MSSSPKVSPSSVSDANAPIAVIAHRGASRLERENTIAAFSRAAECGSDAVELDVRMTADGYLVVHHDAHIAMSNELHNKKNTGISNGEFAIIDMPLSDLPTYVPRLEDALDACEGMWVNLEIKNDPREPDFDPSDRVARAVAEHLHKRGTDDRWVISSFRRETVDVMRAVMPTVRTAWLTLGVPDNEIDAVARSLHNAGHYGVHPWEATLTAESVAVFRTHGLVVNIWTCDDPVRMDQCRQWGVHGVCTNVPDIALAALRA